MPTNPSLFWADTETALARALARAGRGPSTPPVEPARLERTRPEAAPPVEAARTAAPAEFRPPDTPSLEDRLESWRQWLASAPDPTHAFLLDKDGLPLLPRDADGQLVDLASCARGLLVRLAEATASGANDVALRLPDERVLHLLELATPLGPLTVGLVRHDPGAAVFAARFRESLERCFAAEAR